MFVVSGSPHIHSANSTRRIMLDVLIALFPATLVAFVVFGLGALKVVTLSILSCVFAEWFLQKVFIKGESTIGDLSAVVTGLLLGLNLPSSLPWYTIVLGSFFAIGIAKIAFGGLGNNIFNPALVGRVFLLISFPAQMTIFVKPQVASKIFLFNGLKGMSQNAVDAITSATPLSALAEGGVASVSPNYFDYFIGFMGGSIGEISALALIVGGIYLLCRKVINWRIPLIYILTVFVFTGILWLINPTQFANPLFHILTGGLILGAFFMATDMVTSPMTKAGMVVFALGCGFLTVIIRVFGPYPEGVSFAILIMNAFVPLINRGFRPKMYGKEKVK